MSTITVGVDAHLDSLELAAVEKGGPTLSHRTVPNSQAGFHEALAFGDEAGAQRWAIEGAGSYGRAFSRYLIDRALVVTEVPTHSLDELRK